MSPVFYYKYSLSDGVWKINISAKKIEKKCRKICRYQKNAYLCIRVREKRIRLNKLVR